MDKFGKLKLRTYIKFKQPLISNCCQGKQKPSGGFVWKFKK